MGKKSLAHTSKTMERYSEHLQLQSQRKRSRTVSSHEPKTLQYLSPFVFLSVVLLLAIIMLKPGFTGLTIADEAYDFPQFIHEQSITIPANHNFDVDLDTWFVTDGNPVYSITNTEHLSFSINNNLMTITPEKDFTGSEITQLLANNHGKLTRVTMQFTVDDAYYFAEEDIEETPRTGNSITGAFVAITGAVPYPHAGCGAITAPGVYDITADLDSVGGDCIDIQSSDVTLNCQNSVILSSGGGGRGIYFTANQANNIVIQNCEFSGFNDAISMTGVDGTGLVFTNNTFSTHNTGIVLNGATIADVIISQNTMTNVGTGVNSNADSLIVLDNRFTARSTVPGVGIELQGGDTVFVSDNVFNGFDKGTSVNNDLVTNAIFTKNNFTNSQTLHAELWNPAGTIDVYFNASEAGAALGYEAEGNYWEGQPYTVDDDDDADGFADPAGVTARGVAPTLPLDDSTSFAGVGVGAGVEDYGPFVSTAATPPPPPPPPPPPVTGCMNITTSGTTVLSAPAPNCVDIQTTMVTLDCNSLTLQGNGSGIGIAISQSPADRMFIYNCHLDNFNIGLQFDEVHELYLANSSFTNNNIGISFNNVTESMSSGVDSVIAWSLFDSNNIGIRAANAQLLSISKNQFFNHPQYGLHISNGEGVTVFSNNFTNNTNATFFDPSANSQIRQNRYITNNIGLYLEDSSSFTIDQNYLERNTIGMYVDNGSTVNTITTNEFVENTVQAQDLNVPNSNTWNGNYWSDIFSQDLDFLDGDDDHYADSGSNHPYEQSNGGNVLGSVLDTSANINPCHPDVSNDISYNVYLPDYITCPTNGVTFTAPDLFFDCDGASMSGPTAMTGDIAFTASGRNNITIRECTLNDWDIGIISANANAKDLSVLYNTFNRPGTGVLLSGTSIPSQIKLTTIFGNNFENVNSVGIHSVSDQISIIGNTFFPTNAALTPIGIELYGGTDYDIRLNTIQYFDNAILNAIFPATGVLTRNNFLESTVLHADYALVSGTPSLQYYLDPTTGMVGFREEGNYWSESPYTPADDTNADMFADQGGATALPLDDSTVFSAPFTGAAVASGVEDQGPMVLQQQPTECTDGDDNDMDGFIDMQDPECIADPYGREDGQPIVRCGMILTQDASLNNDLTVSGNCIVIGANDVTLDCRGHSITGSGSGTGIDWRNKDNVEIINCVISQFSNGIKGTGLNTLLRNNTLFDNLVSGFGLTESAPTTGGHTVEYNTVLNNPGIINAALGQNTIRGNNFTGVSAEGLDLETINSNIYGNTFENNDQGIQLRAGSQSNNIAYNQFIGNTIHAIQEDPADVNSWSILALNIFGQQVEQGNMWGIAGDGDSAVDLGITDSIGDGFGDTNVPYTSSNPSPGGRVSDGVSDAGPILDPLLAPNVPPHLTGPIPDVSFPKNTVDTSINLYSYFVDPDNGPVTPLTFGPATSTNFAFTVDPTTGVLSITPDNNFVGCNDVIFTAHDGLVMIQSNTVNICTTGTTFGGSSGGSGGGGGGGSSVQRQCRDGIDNDQDGLIDYPEDPDCYSYFDTLEQGNTTACDEAWVCQPFSDCVNGQQTRECRDVQSCGTITKRPALTQTCTPPVVEEPVVVPPPAPRTPPPAPVQQPVVEQTPWVCTSFLPVGILFALIVAFIITALVFVMRWHSQERKSMVPEIIMWIFVIVPFAMLITQLLVCQTTSLLNWIILLAVVLFAVYVTYYTSHLPKPTEDEEDHIQPLADLPPETYTPPPAALREIPVAPPVEKPMEEMEPAYLVEEEPEERKFVSRERIPKRMSRHPEVYLVPRTQERPLPEHRKELRQIKKDLDALKKERQSSTRKEKVSMEKIDHFLNEMEDIKRDLAVVPMKEPEKPAAPTSKKTVKKARKKTTRKTNTQRKTTRKK